MKLTNIKERLSPGPRDASLDESEAYSVAWNAMIRMSRAYDAIGFKPPECRMNRRGRRWDAYLSGTMGCGDTPKEAVREVADIWSCGMRDAKWVDALVKAGATPDQIRDLAEAISAAIDTTSEDQ